MLQTSLVATSAGIWNSSFSSNCFSPSALRNAEAWAHSSSVWPEWPVPDVQWRRVCDTNGLCNVFSKGSGLCHLAVGRKNLDEFAEGGSEDKSESFWIAQVHSPCKTRQARWALHCPSEVPIALLINEKAGYMSGLSWVASMDTVERQPTHFATQPSRVTLGEIWLEAGRAAVQGKALYSDTWLASELALAGYSALEVSSLVHDAAQYYSHKDTTDVPATLISKPNQYVRAWMPRHLCPTCCLPPARGRLHLVFVRNPYSRMVSYFRMRLLVGKRGSDQQGWAFFSEFVSLVARVHNETDAYDEMPINWNHPLKASGASKDFLFHTRAISEWIRQLRMRAGRGRQDFRPIHLESLHSDMIAIHEELCNGPWHYCERLPAVPRIHDGRGQGDEPAGLWTDALIAAMRARYWQDFQSFGYNPDNPMQRKPTT